jgi:hypothetical protein
MCSACGGEYENPDMTALADEPEELTQAQRLAYPKLALLTSEDRLQAALAAAYSIYLIHLEPRV